MHDFTLPTWSHPRKNDIITRQSDYESYSLCPARVGYRHCEGVDTAPSEPMTFGSLEHAMIDEFIATRSSILLTNTDYVKRLYVSVMQKDGWHPLSLTNSMHIDKIVREAIYAFNAWLEQWWYPTGVHRDIISTEVTVVKPLGMLSKGVAVWVQGTPDLVHQGGFDDWKTAGRGWDKNKAGTRIQAPTYVWLHEELFEHLGPVPFTYVIYNRSKETWSEQMIWIEDHNILAAKHALMELASSIHKQVFPPTPSAATGRPGRGWWCSAKFCGAWNICEYKGMLPDDRDLSQVRSPQWTT